MSYFPDPRVPIKNLVLTKPTVKEKRTITLLVILGFASTVCFLIWYFNFHTMGHPLLFYPFTFAVMFMISRIFFEWYHFLGIDVPEKPELKHDFSVDILTTFCPGEPYRMVEHTLLAAKNIYYPHKTVYLCDEADDPHWRAFCKEHDIRHVTREEKVNAKAGNINNALKQATGDICLIMDPDHVPVPEFLDRVLPYFEDEKVGYVQCCQGYYNHDESPIARGACEQTYHFYGPQMMGMGTYGTAQAIGANCTFRRAALDSIGGHAAGLTEDMHTSMNLHAKGWDGLYIPEMLSRGLVPADVLSFYKQQLKWSRGSFELLFERYPFLFRKFNMRKKIHHLMTPLFYLNGFASFIFLILPALSLFMSDVPVHIEFFRFMAYFSPVVAFQLIIRQYVQRWLYKPQERGFHLTGGILMVGTWWIYVTGFFYSLIRKKVPYLPTPKEGQKKNFFKLLLPNLLIIAASAGGIFYGLVRDWSPFTWIMSGFAGMNVLLLTYFCLMCQQKWLVQFEDFIHRKSKLYRWNAEMHIRSFHYSQLAFYGIRNTAVLLALLLFSFTFINTNFHRNNINHLLQQQNESKELSYGGFYLGTTSLEVPLSDADALTPSLQPVRLMFDGQADSVDYNSMLAQEESTKIPVAQIHWKYSDPEERAMLFEQILDQEYSPELKALLDAAEAFERPVFIDLASNLFTDKSNDISREQFTDLWKKLAYQVYRRGLDNTVLVFGARNPQEVDVFYPGSSFCQWVMVDIKENILPEDYHYSLEKLNKPVLYSLKGREVKGTLQNLKKIASFAYAQGLLLDLDQDFQGFAKVTEFLSSHALYQRTPAFLQYKKQQHHGSNAADPSPMIEGSPGSFTLQENGSSFFMRGVAYNVTHDWQDPDMPLTRKALEHDFGRIKQMGTNTIRRYGVTIYDKNILNVAEEYDLHVNYGFWLEENVDYSADSTMLKQYEEKVLANVRRFKDHPALLCWTIGNETWKRLQFHFGEPYLARVRHDYVAFLEQLCKKIKAIDPVHPVFTVSEMNETEIIEELKALHAGAPSLDAVGINVYYEEQIAQVKGFVEEFYPDKPYFISEYGPRGYWHEEYTLRDANNLVKEDSDQEKARLYVDQWEKHIKKHEGHLLGGIAYSWIDRLEGSSTWYGLTDHKNRLKPSYYALQSIWTNKDKVELDVKYASIKAPKKTLFPGRTYVFEAKVSGEEPYTCHWRLKKEQYMETVNKGVAPFDGGEKVKITIPEEPSEYRLYLYVTDGEGNVVTASKGIKTDYSFTERL